MAQVGVRELKARASEIIRAVRDRRARYLITYRGRPVGVLLPLDEVGRREAVAGEVEGGDVWEELTRLGEEIGRGWRSPLTSAELLSDMRR
ncbi:MAG TPA: type II toxin-antitoxin system Phd/YefM family antitoxin [Anaerolineae bacterium]|nr:type II toxin-antitoxin system Phd/YefM family antitoxin [Anaerolineae bacterium]